MRGAVRFELLECVACGVRRTQRLAVLLPMRVAFQSGGLVASLSLWRAIQPAAVSFEAGFDVCFGSKPKHQPIIE